MAWNKKNAHISAMEDVLTRIKKATEDEETTKLNETEENEESNARKRKTKTGRNKRAYQKE
eukprot:13410206-Ditylum_brightwellii.AAC.1